MLIHVSINYYYPQKRHHSQKLSNNVAGKILRKHVAGYSFQQQCCLVYGGLNTKERTIGREYRTQLNLAHHRTSLNLNTSLAYSFVMGPPYSQNMNIITQSKHVAYIKAVNNH